MPQANATGLSVVIALTENALIIGTLRTAALGALEGASEESEHLLVKTAASSTACSRLAWWNLVVSHRVGGRRERGCLR